MILTTERLRLRDFRDDDVDAFHAWHEDPAYLRYYPQATMSRQDTVALVERFIAWQADTPRWRWQLAVCLRVGDGPMQTGELIGCVGVRRESPDDPSANVGYELNPGHWGRGYASEAMASLLRFAFDEVGLDELTCRIVDGNAPSIRLATRLGFVRSLDLPEGPGKDGRIWPQRAEYVLSRAAWPPS